jgi:hypothetical protein
VINYDLFAAGFFLANCYQSLVERKINCANNELKRTMAHLFKAIEDPSAKRPREVLEKAWTSTGLVTPLTIWPVGEASTVNNKFLPVTTDSEVVSRHRPRRGQAV